MRPLGLGFQNHWGTQCLEVMGSRWEVRGSAVLSPLPLGSLKPENGQGGFQDAFGWEADTTRKGCFQGPGH